MAVAVPAVVILVVILLVFRPTRVYLYIWVPLATNLLAWGCLGGCLSIVLFVAARRQKGPEPSLADFYLLVGVAAAYLLVLALATIAVFPPRVAWTKRSVGISLTIAIVIFVCLCLPCVICLMR
jgi:hypothetical protein